jgi:Domain of unknown function (DUF4136)
MKNIATKFLLLALAATMIVSCGPTVKVNTDYDRSANFSAYKTFSVYHLTTTLNVNELNAERIWNSIRKEMIKKGYTENDRNPDLLINAFSVLKDKKYVSANNSYGYGGAYRPYGYWAAGNTTFQAYDYKDGSLMIDIVDAKKDRLVWQGTGNTEITKQPKNPDEAIGSAVTKIMNGFPAINNLN